MHLAFVLLACGDRATGPSDGPTPPPPPPDVPTDADADGSFTPEDCDDGDPTVFPGAPELCDGRQTDCSVAFDEDRGRATFTPNDGPPEDWSGAMTGTVVLDRPGTLELCAGDWPAALDVRAGAIVRGHGGARLVGDPDGEGGRGVVTATAPLTLEDLAVVGGSADLGGDVRAEAGLVATRVRLRNGRAENGGCLHVRGPTVLTDVLVEGCTATADGGGIAVDQTSLTVTGGSFSSNVAFRGGGIFGLESTIGLQGSTATSNKAASGGLLHLEVSDATLQDVTVDGGGEEATFGGALAVQRGSLALLGTTVTGAHASSRGGAVYATESDVVLRSSALTANAAVSFVGGQVSNFGGYGGGVYLADSSLDCADSDLGGNEARWGAAVYAGFHSSGSDVVLASTCSFDSALLGGDTGQVHIAIDGFGGEILYDPGVDASFTCDADACGP
ncbi:MAG: hypothetical protein H6736_04855 [Alphaproteobacteria bacterium]|nr:hypothetical protein [Alphaproteobacteria bacterium]